MAFNYITGTDGIRRLVDTTTGKTVEVDYPTTASTGGRHKILTATYSVPQEENGTTYYLNSATEFVTTLPAPFLGADYTFIVKAAPTSASYTVVTASSANVIKGQGVNAAGVAGDAGTADDTITFVDGQAVAGDEVRLKSDGTSWFAKAFCAVAAGVTFTQAST
jgi:hypothetical protein